jgi:hypothetical protein
LIALAGLVFMFAALSYGGFYDQYKSDCGAPLRQTVQR